MRYDGKWRLNRRHGFGMSYDGQREADGEWIYRGRWRRGLKHGVGTLRLATDLGAHQHFFPRGFLSAERRSRRRRGRRRNFRGDESRRYAGEFRDGRMCGEGAYVHANGDRYEGQFLDDTPDGHGSFYEHSGGARTDGAWRNGKVVEDDDDRPPGAYVFTLAPDASLADEDSSDDDSFISDDDAEDDGLANFEAALEFARLPPSERKPRAEARGVVRMPCRTQGGADLNAAVEFVRAAREEHRVPRGNLARQGPGVWR